MLCHVFVTDWYDNMKPTDCIYVVPGIMGSSLARPGHGEPLVWSLNYEHLVDTLANNPDSLGPGELLEPVEVIRHVTVKNFIKVSSIYEDLLNFLRQCYKETRIVPFPYDWRKTNEASAQRLVRRILQDRRDQKRISIVSHSMGGLVTLLAVRMLKENPATRDVFEKIYRIVNIGTPHIGSLQSFRTLKEGRPRIFAPLDYWFAMIRLFHPFAAANLVDLLPTFNSLFELLPPQRLEILTRAGKTLSAIDPALWALASEDTLRQAVRVHKLIEDAPTERLATIYSSDLDTESGFHLDAKYGIASPQWEKGDETVTMRSAESVVERNRRRPVAARVVHKDLPNHRKVHDDLRFLLRN